MEKLVLIGLLKIISEEMNSIGFDTVLVCNNILQVYKKITHKFLTFNILLHIKSD